MKNVREIIWVGSKISFIVQEYA